RVNVCEIRGGPEKKPPAGPGPAGSAGVENHPMWLPTLVCRAGAATARQHSHWALEHSTCQRQNLSSTARSPSRFPLAVTPITARILAAGRDMRVTSYIGSFRDPEGSRQDRPAASRA